MYKWQVGQMMVVTRDDSFYTGATGTIERRGMLLGMAPVYEMLMPQFNDVPCPGCGTKHMARCPFAENELRPLNDPDEEQTRVEDEQLEESTS